MTITRVNVARLQELCDPFEADNLWPEVVDPIKRSEVQEAIERGDLLAADYTTHGFDWVRKQHIARIAYLVVNPVNKPITIDVGVPSLGCHVAWPIEDGNHRFAAAIYRQDQWILADTAGDVEELEDLEFDSKT